MSSAATVHYQQPGFETMAEIDGHGDTCGIDAMLAYLHVAKGLPLSLDLVDALRQHLINLHLFDHGMTMQSIAAALSQLYGVHPVSLVPWGGVTDTGLRTDLKNATLARQAVILETSRAYNLPDNQPGVQNHFVTVWGIDSELGYWTANGDTETALRSTGITSPVWYTWANIEAAAIGSYMILPAIVEGPSVAIVIDKNAAGLVTGAHENGDYSKHVGAGFALTIEQRALTALSIADNDRAFAGREICTLSAPHGGTPQVLTYSQQWNVQVYAGEDLQTIVHELLNPAPVTAEVTTVQSGTVQQADVHNALLKFLEPLLPLIGGEDNAQ